MKRRILNYMEELRVLNMEKTGAPPQRVKLCRERFSFFDAQLDHVHVGQSAQDFMENEKFMEVMTSGDFVYALGDYVSQAMLPAYTRRGFNFEAFIKPDTAPTFQAVTRKQRRAGVDDLEYVGEKGEARPGAMPDANRKQWRPYIWEKQFDFSMATLVNDDLGYFNDTATAMGEAARRTLEKYVSRMLWNATTIARLVGLGALYATTGRLTTARISTARMAMNQRVDDNAEPITAALKFIIHHPGLVDTVAQIQNSMLVPELATNAQNVVRGTFTPIEDPYCVGTAPNLPWFALTDYHLNGIVPFVLVRRAGVPGPWIARKRSDIEFVASILGGGNAAAPIWGDFATSNIIVKVHDEFGTYIDVTEGNLVDSRGAWYSSGTAP